MSEFFKLLPAIQYQKCASLFYDLNDLDYAHIKGDALSLQAYGETGKRSFSDIDILVSKKNLGVVENILLKNGFQTRKRTRQERVFQLSHMHQTDPWIKLIPPFGELEIDLNFDIHWENDSQNTIDIDEFLSDSEICNIHGCTLKLLPIQKAFLQMILHHYKHLNSIYSFTKMKSIRKDFFCDVLFFWRRIKDLNLVEDVIELCEKYFLFEYVYYMLHYTNVLFPGKIDEKDIATFENEQGILFLNCYGLTKEERKVWNVDFFTRLHSENEFDLIRSQLSSKDFARLNQMNKVL